MLKYLDWLSGEVSSYESCVCRHLGFQYWTERVLLVLSHYRYHCYYHYLH